MEKMIGGNAKISDIDKFTRTVRLSDLEREIQKIYEGKQIGRIIVSIKS